MDEAKLSGLNITRYQLSDKAKAQIVQNGENVIANIVDVILAKVCLVLCTETYSNGEINAWIFDGTINKCQCITLMETFHCRHYFGQETLLLADNQEERSIFIDNAYVNLKDCTGRSLQLLNIQRFYLEIAYFRKDSRDWRSEKQFKRQSNL